MITAENSISLSENKRRLALRSLLVYTFIMVIGFSMLMPLVAVHFVNNIGLTATLVGAALAVRQLTQQGLTVFGGALSDRFGARKMICFGVLLRALGFASLAFADQPTMLFIALIISALGGALFEAPYQASIAALTEDDNRDNYYLMSNFIGGIASAVGPLVGILLLKFDFSVVCLCAALCFSINFIIAAIFFPDIRATEHTEESNKKRFGGFDKVFENKVFVLFTALMIGYWFSAMQINISFPLWAEKITGNLDSVGIMFALSAILTVALQYPLVKIFQRKFDTKETFLIGIVMMSLGLACIGFISNYFAFLACVGFYTLGVLLTRPTHQSITADLADKNALGVFMGFSSLGLAVGGGLGSVLGGWLFDLAELNGWSQLPWITFSLVGLMSALGFHFLFKKSSI
ncbi:MFS transporter [Aliikangiella coralliicola]|uniref:MFS transporter n=1 Tax=Aliikangiella coralliicola TaxID=2592383 RepID=A0A545UGI3_9GAMM|nr:MFS transporter [Aliikangiella coralliicola]TQV88579.1 MFS transporter [Aliikangiella coralliicola]